MKLDALRESEERKLAAKKTRSRPEKSKATEPKPIVQEIVMAKTSKRLETILRRHRLNIM